MLIVSCIIIGFVIGFGVAYVFLPQLGFLPSRTVIGVLRIGIPTDIGTIDIHYAQAVADFEVLGKVCESLFIIDVNTDGSLVYKPWLVEKWYVVSPTEYVFKLKSGIKFHNGKPLDAWDVNASIMRSMRISPIGRMLLSDASGNPIIDRIEVLNSTTFKIVLRKPFSFLTEHLAHLSTAILPRDIAEKYYNRPITEISDAIGTGPYHIVARDPGNSVILERFDGYWGVKPLITRVVYTVISASTARVTALISNQIDIAVGIPPELVDQVRSRGFNIITTAGTRLVIVAINVNSISSAIARRALNHAIDKRAIVNSILRGYGSVAQWVTPPIFPGVKTFTPYEYDPDKARQMLRESNISISRPLKLLVSTRGAKDVEVAQIVQRYLKDVGIDVVITTMEHKAFLDAVFKRHEFDLAIYGPSPSSLYYGLTYWRTGSSLNGPGYSNPRYDKLLDDIAGEMDVSKRNAMLEEAQEILWSDCPAIWLYAESIIYGVSPRVEGLKIVLSYLRFENTYLRG